MFFKEAESKAWMCGATELLREAQIRKMQTQIDLLSALIEGADEFTYERRSEGYAVFHRESGSYLGSVLNAEQLRAKIECF